MATPGVETPLASLPSRGLFASSSHTALPHMRCVILTYQPPLRFEQGPVDAIHLVVEPAGVAEVVPCAISPPERGGHGPTVDTFSPL